MDEEMEELYKEFAEHIVRFSNLNYMLKTLTASNEENNNFLSQKEISHEE